ncbi:hypothetical protein CVS40_9995 [Lucilia cuprina]|nr:hypothetical protein CVS40_9995 [Lucilia cuprina]
MSGGSVSKRHIRRLISQKKREFVHNLNDVEAQSVENSGGINHIDSEKLAAAFENVVNEISSSLIEELLAILKVENLEVPLSMKTLIPNREKALIKQVSPGVYSHFGVRKQLESIGSVVTNYEEIIVDLWPILLRVVNIKNISILPIGNNKPNDITEYFADFIFEMKNLIENGIEFDRNIFGHTSSHGCTKCVQVGRKINKVLTYSTESGVLISDKDFEERKYQNYHKNIFLSQRTPLEDLGVKMLVKWQ